MHTAFFGVVVKTVKERVNWHVLYAHPEVLFDVKNVMEEATYFTARSFWSDGESIYLPLRS
jgi:hypothetical protein